MNPSSKDGSAEARSTSRSSKTGNCNSRSLAIFGIGWELFGMGLYIKV